MRKVYELTTEEVRDAFSLRCNGWCHRCGDTGINSDEFHDTEFDLWLVAERHRVADMAMAKERERIIKLLAAEFGAWSEAVALIEVENK